jgi:rSAM/selenodomain-associated transferase 1
MADTFDTTDTTDTFANAETALVIMARYPELGKTKTRLARSIGDEQTLRLYTAFLTDLAQRFAGQQYDLHWAHTPADVDYLAFSATLAPEQTRRMWSFAQQGPDLGARLHHAFQRTYQHGYQRTLLIGSDSPHISHTIIETAQVALDDADVVLGPADDGGYYLIAMCHPYDVFSGIPMSTSVVLDMTIESAQRQGLRVRLVEQLLDVDELSDLQRLARLLQEDATLAPVTATHLATLRGIIS